MAIIEYGAKSMVNWESSANVVALRCLERLKAGNDIKKDPDEIEEWSDTIKAVAEALTILIMDIKASENQKNVQEVAINYLLYLERTITDSDAEKAKIIAESIKKVGEALDVLIKSNGPKTETIGVPTQAISHPYPQI